MIVRIHRFNALAAMALAVVCALAAPSSAHAVQQGNDRPAAASDTVTDPKQVERARSLNIRLRCPVCAGASIEESPVYQSEEMRAVVREQIAAGKTDREIEDYFISKYGEWILLEPPKRGINLLVYVLPLVLVLGGGVFVYRTARQWTRNSGEPTDA